MPQPMLSALSEPGLMRGTESLGHLHFKQHKSRAVVVVQTSLVEQVMTSIDAVENDDWASKDVEVQDVGIWAMVVSYKPLT